MSYCVGLDSTTSEVTLLTLLQLLYVHAGDSVAGFFTKMLLITHILISIIS